MPISLAAVRPSQEDLGPGTRLAVDHKVRSDLHRSLFHDGYSQASRWSYLRVKTSSVILNAQHYFARLTDKAHMDLCCLGVLGDIVERLLGDAIEGDGHGIRHDTVALCLHDDWRTSAALRCFGQSLEQLAQFLIL